MNGNYVESRLYRELRIALNRTSPDELKQWGVKSAARLPAIGKRRLKNLGYFLGQIGNFTAEEIRNAFAAWKRGNLLRHLENRSARAIDGSVDIGRRVLRTIGAMGQALYENPKETAPGLLALVIGFYVGSGGLDGNGGVPDTDITILGIGEHRSIFTHSIISGIIMEGSILALSELADLVCDKLPEDRSPFWDQVRKIKDQIGTPLAVGTSSGIAYHLAVDGLIQVAPYKDLPFSMPMEAHQTILVLNAAAEGSDAVLRAETTGTKVTGFVSDGLASVKAGFKTFLG